MTSQPTQFRNDSYCGLYCGACEILNLYRTAREQGREAQWDDLPAPMNGVIPPADLVCTGCKTELLFAGCLKCDIRICGNQKGVEACILCAEYPCQLVEQSKVFLAERAKDLLPHTAVMFSQTDHIREIGYPAWCAEQAARWLCPECGTPFTWYQKNCMNCGIKLDSIKEHKSVDFIP
jgi:hypothetical protein